MQGIALNLSGDTAPDWIQLTPPGPRIIGRDGRNWRMTDPAAVVKAFNASSQRPHIDIEHSTQLKGPKGEPAPAVGWIEEMDVRDGALWGRVDWTAEGLNAVSSRAYRYLSPAFTFDRGTSEVLRMVSAGLTNNPNLDMAALNASGDEENDTTMDPAILEALSLNSNASAADAVVAIVKLKEAREMALNSAETPDAALFVPRADHQLALNRIEAFETAEKARTETAINSAVDAAIVAGKIAPASREYHLAACHAEGGLARFEAAMAATPSITGKSPLDGAKPGEALNSALTADELAVCQMFNTDPAAFAAAKAKEA